MNFHRVSHLNRQDVRIEELTVHSLEMGMYLAEVNYDDRLGFLVDENNKPQQFHSVEEVKQALNRCTIYNAHLVHKSAYDEMCGGTEKVDNTLKVPLFVAAVG
ncbi:DUF6482 family protein [Rheinheimera baltica]|uniref:DUF6482 family protein n=1 Tax=Rheinheimera baltica TaxID=67576 RepID=A0ABT9HXV0_9GAMM|nr:DUF6482 family protein [Rheinheimera baltica]MDP5135630.1 DUF6482 family protein [Rheinheimera baltica]MDP5141464.1 DUF6482 family protein [Rheinheimera baltica]MDP5148701.1 DUF6482 family protein [Rheinheimera baltica]MDP5189837.1 DUF6482 family protein [Rheinheimera baltica]